MANFPNMILTNSGNTLQAKVQGGAPLQFTKIGMGDGQLNGQPISPLTQLIHQTVTVPIDGGQVVGKDTYRVKGIFSNQELAAGFTWREIGVYAQDPDVGEVLYCYANAGDAGDYIPPPDQNRIESTLYCSMTVSNASSVTIQIPASDTFIPMDEKGAAGGVAPLNENKQVPPENLPPMNYDPAGAAQDVKDELMPLIQDAGGFVLMEEDIPPEQRKKNRLYAKQVEEPFTFPENAVDMANQDYLGRTHIYPSRAEMVRMPDGTMLAENEYDAKGSADKVKTELEQIIKTIESEVEGIPQIIYGVTAGTTANFGDVFTAVPGFIISPVGDGMNMGEAWIINVTKTEGVFSKSSKTSKVYWVAMGK